MSGQSDASDESATHIGVSPRRVLFVSYQFPPAGGVGVQRVTKFIKYLPEFGWQSSVLTVVNPSVPLLDESYQRDIPAGTIIRRARTLEPGYSIKQTISASTDKQRPSIVKQWLKTLVRSACNLILQPDAQILWHPAAEREGLRLLSQTRHDAIIATGPPFSSLLLGATLATKTGLPLILDYRDEWSISNSHWENKKQGWISNWIQNRQQRRAMSAAAVLLATSPSSAGSIEYLARQSGLERPSACIYNGFDPDDFHGARAGAEPAREPGTPRFRLAFVGTLWNLNSIEPLVDAIGKLGRDRFSLLDQLELVIAGRRTAQQEGLLDNLNGLSCTLTRLPFIEHAEAVTLMQSADALLMLNSGLPHAERIINAKTFEYMAARRPIVAIAPRGDVWDIIGELPGTILCEPSDVAGIAERLATLLEQHRCGVSFQDWDWQIDRYNRRNLTGELAELLDGVINCHREPVAAGT